MYTAHTIIKLQGNVASFGASTRPVRLYLRGVVSVTFDWSFSFNTVQGTAHCTGTPSSMRVIDRDLCVSVVI